MFKDKVEVRDFEKMDPEYQDLLKRLLAIQADCEIGGPHLYVDEIFPTAPTKLDQISSTKSFPRLRPSWISSLSRGPRLKKSTTTAKSRAWPAIWASMSPMF